MTRIIGSLSLFISGPRDPNQPGQEFTCSGAPDNRRKRHRKKEYEYAYQ
jgi:hypothetical protein